MKTTVSVTFVLLINLVTSSIFAEEKYSVDLIRPIAQGEPYYEETYFKTQLTYLLGREVESTEEIEASYSGQRTDFPEAEGEIRSALKVESANVMVDGELIRIGFTHGDLMEAVLPASGQGQATFYRNEEKFEVSEDEYAYALLSGLEPMPVAWDKELFLAIQPPRPVVIGESWEIPASSMELVARIFDAEGFVFETHKLTLTGTQEVEGKMHDEITLELLGEGLVEDTGMEFRTLMDVTMILLFPQDPADPDSIARVTVEINATAPDGSLGIKSITEGTMEVSDATLDRSAREELLARFEDSHPQAPDE